MNTRTRWTIGILVVLVIGLGVALIIVAADDSDDSGSPGTTAGPATETLTEPSHDKLAHDDVVHHDHTERRQRRPGRDHDTRRRLGRSLAVPQPGS